MDAEILTYSRAKGIFAGLTLNGAVVHRDDDAMRAFYGPGVTVRGVLTGQVQPPPASSSFLYEVRAAREQARAAAAQ